MFPLSKAILLGSMRARSLMHKTLGGKEVLQGKKSLSQSEAFLFSY